MKYTSFSIITNNLICPTCAQVQPLKIINLASLFKRLLPATFWLALTSCQLFASLGKCQLFLGSHATPHTHTYTRTAPSHKSNVTGTCKMSCSWLPPPPSEGVALGTARHVYHNRAINFIRLATTFYGLFIFDSCKTFESECLLHTWRGFVNAHYYLQSTAHFEQTFYFVILIDGHKPTFPPRVCSSF